MRRVLFFAAAGLLAAISVLFLVITEHSAKKMCILWISGYICFLFSCYLQRFQQLSIPKVTSQILILQEITLAQVIFIAYPFSQESLALHRVIALQELNSLSSSHFRQFQQICKIYELTGLSVSSCLLVVTELEVQLKCFTSSADLSVIERRE